MRRILLALLLPGLALAQADAPAPPPLPGTAAEVQTTLIDDRDPEDAGSEATASDDAPASGPDDASLAPLPEKILVPPPPEAAPAVSIRTDGSGDVVEEYRQNGRIYMVKVRPERGVPYTLLDTNGDGRLDAKDGEGPVRPVYWTLYEWN